MSVRRKLLFVGLAFSLVSSLVVGLVAESLYSRALRTEVSARLRADAELLARILERESAEDELAKDYGRALGCRVTLIDVTGRVVGDSDVPAAELPHVENHFGREEIIKARLAGWGEATRASATVGQPMFYVARRITGRDGASLYVRLAFPLSRIKDEERAHRNGMAAATLGVTLALTAIAFLFARAAARPIEEMKESALAIAEGRGEAELVLTRPDEIGDLARVIERMRKRLTEQIGALAEEKNLLSSVLSSMKEAVLVVDRDHRVVLVNAAMRDLVVVPLKDAEGRRLVEALRDAEVCSSLERALAGEVVERTLRHKGARQRVYELQAQPLRSPAGELGGAVGVFFDITRLEVLESVRRDFVANVSHELRTPLTAIRAFIETLLDETSEGRAPRAAQREFLEIVAKHAHRMGRLIDDLTDLSLIETGAISLHPEPVELLPRVAEILNLQREVRERMGVTATTEIPPGFTLNFDPERLEQVLWNLLDNALKFNRAGGTITVRAGEDRRGKLVTIEDTGLGIAKAEHEKVFNRFYRTDTVKSRELGGTGLGLAIVKHLMRLQGGSVSLESELGRGSSFTLVLPPESQVPERRAEASLTSART